MDTFQGDPSMMDMINLQGGMMDPSMMNNIELGAFSDDVQMDLGNVPHVSFDMMDSVQAVAMDENGTKTDSTESATASNSNAIGAGPLPTGFGIQPISSTGSTLTEFTKRRNWSQRVLEEIKDLLYILTPDGRLLYVSPSIKLLTGYEQNQLFGKFISEYIHPDDSGLFIREFNESIATGNPLRFFYRFRNAENKYVIFECHGHPHLTNDVSHLEMTGGPVNSAGFCRGFFMMARPYPTRNSELLDSFLEHKIENVRLQARIAALKREESDEAEAQAKNFPHKGANGHGSSRAQSNSERTPESASLISRGESSDFSSMPPPAKPTTSNIALTREALDEANAFARPDSITDKMARYEGSSHVDSIEMFTGLRYREGERSHGISTGGTSPALIRGDAGIDIPVDKADPRYGTSYLDKKPKKVKSTDEYVCTDCGTLDSPEWRKGPNGPKTLCNACGLRWAKKEKKKSGPETNRNGNSTSAAASGSGSIPTLKQNSSNGST